MLAAVTEDRALLGSNLSAGDGPKLAGVSSRIVFTVSNFMKDSTLSFLIPHCLLPTSRHGDGKSLFDAVGQ
jgi:hypothetical protein